MFFFVFQEHLETKVIQETCIKIVHWRHLICNLTIWLILAWYTSLVTRILKNCSLYTARVQGVENRRVLFSVWRWCMLCFLRLSFSFQHIPTKSTHINSAIYLFKYLYIISYSDWLSFTWSMQDQQKQIQTHPSHSHRFYCILTHSTHNGFNDTTNGPNVKRSLSRGPQSPVTPGGSSTFPVGGTDGGVTYQDDEIYGFGPGDPDLNLEKWTPEYLGRGGGWTSH